MSGVIFSRESYGHLTSNIAESLNSWILKARELPILAMLETIRHQLMDWFTARSKLELNTKGLLVQKVANDIQSPSTIMQEGITCSNLSEF